MPLIKSKSKAAFDANVSAEMHAGKPQKQALAIAFDVKRRARATGGSVFEGPIVSAVPGRTDEHPIDVASGSYVFPADFVSSLGENNSLAGLDAIKKMGPKGLKAMIGRHGIKASSIRRKRARGGQTGSLGTPVPIAAAGGEYVLKPAEVAEIGDGDVDLGHRLLDELVMKRRARHIKTLKDLPGPAKD